MAGFVFPGSATGPEPKCPCDQFAEQHRLPAAGMRRLVAPPSIGAADAQSRDRPLDPLDLQKHPELFARRQPGQSLDDEVVTVAGVADVAAPGSDGVDDNRQMAGQAVTLKAESARLIGPCCTQDAVVRCRRTTL